MSRETPPQSARSDTPDRTYTSTAELFADVERCGRLALKIEQLPPDMIEAIRQAEVPPEYRYLDDALIGKDG